MLKKMSMTVAIVGALSFVSGVASAQGTGTEPPKAPNPSGGAMSKSGGGGAMMKKGSMSKSKGGMMMKKHSKKM